MLICMESGCDREVRARLLCSKHLQSFYVSRKPDKTTPSKNEPRKSKKITILPKVNNNLESFILEKKAEDESKKGKKIFIDDISADIALFCGVGLESITSLRFKRVQPSIYVAIKLSEYFKVSVNDIFSV